MPPTDYAIPSRRHFSTHERIFRKIKLVAFFAGNFPRPDGQREEPEAWPPTAHTSSAACTRAFPTHVRTAQVRDGEFLKPIPLWRRAAHPPKLQ